MKILYDFYFHSVVLTITKIICFKRKYCENGSYAGNQKTYSGTLKAAIIFLLMDFCVTINQNDKQYIANTDIKRRYNAEIIFDDWQYLELQFKQGSRADVRDAMLNKLNFTFNRIEKGEVNSDDIIIKISMNRDVDQFSEEMNKFLNSWYFPLPPIIFMLPVYWSNINYKVKFSVEKGALHSNYIYSVGEKYFIGFLLLPVLWLNLFNTNSELIAPIVDRLIFDLKKDRFIE